MIRHPRYLSGAIGLTTSVVFENFAGLYLTALLFTPLSWLLIVEERELVERFGDEFRAYQRELPRFIPREIESHVKLSHQNK